MQLYTFTESGPVDENVRLGMAASVYSETNQIGLDLNAGTHEQHNRRLILSPHEALDLIADLSRAVYRLVP